MIYAPILEINDCLLKKCTIEELEKLYGSPHGYEIMVTLRELGKFNDINEKLDEDGKLNIYFNKAYLDWLIYFENNIIGNIVVENYNKEHKSMNLSCYIDEKYFSLYKGIIVEMLDYLFKNLDIENIIYVFSGTHIDIIEQGLIDDIGFEFLSHNEEVINEDLNIKEITDKSIISKEKFYNKYKDMKEIKEY